MEKRKIPSDLQVLSKVVFHETWSMKFLQNSMPTRSDVLKSDLNGYNIKNSVDVTCLVAKTSHHKTNDDPNEKQSFINSIAAVAYSKILPGRMWKRQTLDTIMRNAGRTTFGPGTSGDADDGTIEIDEFIITVRTERPTKITRHNLSPLLQQLLAGVLVVRDDRGIIRAYAVWKDEEEFYCFDPDVDDTKNDEIVGDLYCRRCVLFKTIELSVMLTILQDSLKLSTGGGATVEYVPVDVMRIVKRSERDSMKRIRIDLSDNALPMPPLIMGSGNTIDVKSATDTLSRLDRLISVENKLLDQMEAQSQLKLTKRPPPVKELFDVNRQEFKSPAKSTTRQTNFQTIGENGGGKMILRGTKHIHDSRNTNDAHSLPAAILAIVTLQTKRCSQWDDEVMDAILEKTFETFADASKQRDITISDIGDVTIDERRFTVDSCETAIVGQLGSRRNQNNNRDVLDLNRALTEFFARHDSGVLQGPNVVGVWQEGPLYYMYDPWECDEYGNRIILKDPDGAADGAKEKDVESSVGVSKGAACLTCYESIKELADAYVSNVAPDKRRVNFLISTPKILERCDMEKDWYNWKGISKGTWLLRGSYVRAKTSNVTRQSQSPCAAAVALAMAMMVDEKEWSKTIVNQIIHSGEDFHRKCMMTDRGYMKPEDLLNELTLRDSQVSFEIQGDAMSGLMTPDGPMNLKHGIEEFFKHDNMGILTVRNISIGIWKDNHDVYYYFDPFPRDEHAREKDGGAPCAIRTTDINFLVDTIESNMPPGRNNVYSVSRVKIKLWPLPETPPENATPKNFVTLETEAVPRYAILRDDLHEGSPRFENRRDRQTLCILAQAMAVDTLIPASEWNASTLENILIDGDRIFDKHGTSERSYELTDLLHEPIQIGSNSIELTLGEERRTVFLSEDNMKGDVLKADDSLRDILENYFDGDGDSGGGIAKFAFLISDAYTAALWSDGSGGYFLFDPKACDDKGAPSQKRLADAKIRQGEMSKHLKRGQKIKEIPSSVSEEDECEHDQQYSACVMWFDSVIYLLMKILVNVPVECIEQQVKFTPVEFRNRLNLTIPTKYNNSRTSTTSNETAARWNDFRETERGLYIIRGNLSQRSDVFDQTPNRDNQDAPMSVTALVFANCHSCSLWNGDLLDVILKFGDKLYSSTYEKRRHMDEYQPAAGPWRYKLRPRHIARKLMISDYRVTLDFLDDVLEGDIKASDSTLGVLSLRKALRKFFEQSTDADDAGCFYVLVSCKHYTAAMWMDSEGYFYSFDPHECGPNGRYHTNGVACCLRTKNLQTLADIYTANVLDYVSRKEADASNLFTLHGISVKAEKNRSGDYQEQSTNDNGNTTLGKRKFNRTRQIKSDGFKDQGVEMDNDETDKMESAVRSTVGEKEVGFKSIPKQKKNVTRRKQSKEGTRRTASPKRNEPSKVSNRTFVEPEKLQTAKAPPSSETTSYENDSRRLSDVPAITDEPKDSLTEKIMNGETIYSENLETITPPDYMSDTTQDEDEDIQITELSADESTSEPLEYTVQRFDAKSLLPNMFNTTLQTIAEEAVEEDKRYNPKTKIKPLQSENIPSKIASKDISVNSVNRSAKLSPERKKHTKNTIVLNAMVDIPSLRTKQTEEFVASKTFYDQNELQDETIDKTKYKTKDNVSSSIGRNLKPSTKSMRREYSILHGTTSLANSNEEYFQPGPHILAAISLAHLKDSSTWTPTDLDEINTIGAELLKTSLKDLKEPFDASKDRLHVTMIARDFTLRNNSVHLKIEEASARGQVIPDFLEETFYDFFDNHTAGILNTAILVLGIWRRGTIYYLYNCLPCDSTGNVRTRGTSCLMSFEKLEGLCGTVMANLLQDEIEFAFSIRPIEVGVTADSDNVESEAETIENENKVSSALLTYVQTICNMPSTNKIAKNSGSIVTSTRSKGFVPYVEGGEILRTSTSHVAYEHRILPVCIAASVIASVKNVERWNESVLNKVVIIGRKLYRDFMQLFDSNNYDAAHGVPMDDWSMKSCKIEGKTVDVDVASAVEHGYLFAEELLRALEDFFHGEQNTAIFYSTVKLILMKRQLKYYCLDAASGCNPYLLRFDDLQHLAGFICARCFKKGDPAATLRRFDITAVRVSESKLLT